MNQRTLDLAAYAASGMTPEEYRTTGGFRNVIGDFTSNIGDSLAKYANAQKVLQEKQNSKIASFMQSMNTNVDITSLNSQQQKAATEFLVSQKRQYADAAMQITNYDPTDDTYMDLIDIMNSVNNRVKNFSGQVDTFKETKLKFVQDVDAGIISEGNDVGQFAITTDALTNSSSFLVDESGNIAFSNELGQIDLFKDLPSYFNKDFATAKKLTDLMETVYSSGETIDGNRENMLRMRLTNMISQGGRSTLLSLANDDFFVEGGMGIIDPTLYEEENEKDLREAVINGYIQALKDTAAEGAKKKKKNTRARATTSGQQKLQQMQNLITNNQDAIVDSVNSLIPKIQEGDVSFVDLYNVTTRLGLDINKVESDGDVIGYQFEHPLVKQKVEISLDQINQPESLQKALLRSLGTDYLGINLNAPVTEETEETESDLPIIE